MSKLTYFILDFKVVYQMMLRLSLDILWPSNSFGLGRPEGQLLADSCQQIMHGQQLSSKTGNCQEFRGEMEF